MKISTVRAALSAVLMLTATHALSDDGGVSVELNKLEAGDNACRAFLLLENHTANALTGLKLDLVMFDLHGIVAKRIAVETAPLPGDKTMLKVFDVDGLSCDAIDRILLNDVIACSDASGARDDCLAMVSIRAKPGLTFIK